MPEQTVMVVIDGTPIDVSAGLAAMLKRIAQASAEEQTEWIKQMQKWLRDHPLV